jgi:TolB-like protein
MKTKFYSSKKFVLFYFLIIALTANTFAQKRPSITVLNIDTHGLDYTPEQLGNLVRIELERLDTFEVMDRYDVVYLVKKNNLDISNCYGKIGLLEVGNSLKSDKMLSGSIELYGETIILTLRLVDVHKSVIEKSYVKEYLNLPKEMQSMIRVSLREMFGLSNDPNFVAQLTKPNTYENIVSTPQTDRLNLSGPRMGIAAFTGQFRRILRDKTENGGFDMYPYMYQFGYQFEKMYLNEGNFQALFECIPMISGIDQGKLIPSVALMNGIRDNIGGWEFAVGPNFAISKRANVFMDKNGLWELKSNYSPDKVVDSTKVQFYNRADSRGFGVLSPSFVIAVGKTFKSGRMNFPVNIYFIPAKDGLEFGLSLGYNAKNSK